MSTRIRSQLGRPWIKRPRQIAAAIAVALALSASSAYAQRGGCAGGSGGTGGSAGGSLGAAGGMGGAGGGQFNPGSMLAGPGMSGTQVGTHGMFFTPALQGDAEPAFDHRAYLQERRAFRLAQAEERKQRLALRPEKQSRLVTTRNRSRPGT
jgi:hypothetical protein